MKLFLGRTALIAMAVKELFHVWRDRRILNLAIIVFLPPVFTLLLGHAFEAGKLKDVRAILLDRDRSKESTEVFSLLSSKDIFVWQQPKESRMTKSISLKTSSRLRSLYLEVGALGCTTAAQFLHRKRCCRPYSPQPRCACYLFDCDAPPASDRAMRRRRLQAMFSSSTEFPSHRKEDYFIILWEQRHRRNDRVLPHPRAEDRLGPHWTRHWPAA